MLMGVWFFRQQTQLSPDQVMIKLINVTDQRVTMALGPKKANDTYSGPIVFSGELDFSDQKFKLLKDPYSIFTYARGKVILQGNTRVSENRTWINIWVRPSAPGLVILCLWVLVLLRAGQYYGGMPWNKEKIVVGVALSVTMVIASLITVSEVRSAKSTFKSVFPE